MQYTVYFLFSTVSEVVVDEIFYDTVTDSGYVDISWKVSVCLGGGWGGGV